MDLTSLPIELQEYFLEYADYKDIINYCKVNRLTNEICRDRAFWKSKAKVSGLPKSVITLIDKSANPAMTFSKYYDFKDCLKHELNDEQLEKCYFKWLTGNYSNKILKYIYSNNDEDASYDAILNVIREGKVSSDRIVRLITVTKFLEYYYNADFLRFLLNDVRGTLGLDIIRSLFKRVKMNTNSYNIAIILLIESTQDLDDEREELLNFLLINYPGDINDIPLIYVPPDYLQILRDHGFTRLV